jgi:hypothetical protein
MSDIKTTAIMTPAEYAADLGPPPERRQRALDGIRRNWRGQLRRAQLLGMTDQWISMETESRNLDMQPGMHLQILREYAAAGWRTREVDYAIYLPAAAE